MNAENKVQSFKYMTLAFFMLVIGGVAGICAEKLNQNIKAVKENKQPEVFSNPEIKNFELPLLSDSAAKEYCAVMLERQYRDSSLYFDELRNSPYQTDINVISLKAVALAREKIFCSARIRFSTFDRNRERVSMSSENTIWFKLTKPEVLDFKPSSKDEFESELAELNGH